MKSIATRVGQVAVHVEGEGPPLFLLHSVAHDRHDFDGVRPALARRFRTYALDWPGHGDSEMWSPPPAASVLGMCQALEEVVAALDVGPAIFMGNSVGGTACLRLAGTRPELVQGLVLVDSGGVVERSPLVSALCWIQGRVAVRRWTGMTFARSYMKREGAARDAVLARIAENRRRPGFIEMDAAMWRSFGRPEADVSEFARAVRAPTLIVWGTDDPVLRAKAEGRRLQALIPHADYVELATGHVPFVEEPSAFLLAVTPFLESNRVAARPLPVPLA